MQEEAAKVFLVDSRAVSRVGLSVLLGREADLDVVGSAADLTSALPNLTRLSPDVVIIDGQDLETASSAELRLLIGSVADEQPKVLAIVSRLDQVAHDWQAAGLWGVLDNRASPQRIAAAVRMISAGYRLVVPHCETEEQNAAEPAEPAKPAKTMPAGLSEPDLEAVGITRRERDVLELIIRGYSNAEISEALFLSESTVKSHVQRMLDKLALRNRVHAVIYAYEKGIVRAGGNVRSAL
ncbi:response regulator transcription factor [Streptomyces cocklensis]|uniref:DNA-binding response regulator, NarL/FixJ family, contains REC and HTH domains n=1 Tax=Actinacidiphila cocklensis TaxID=887465 RepID=A0A9W4E0X7_9ACTN|nr:response regulator transcription factor [Actinacidiphila cocklensis]MDD1059806.1 response regulator transcription factor [Actinacidiphila cocklensis]WSX72673.1 response regulator transcription factor [Streptomyces sp. NBC_00899]WSX81258.1 response regulator transcription factor [Streptomyces sp. NBC_00899]CAG6397082.1 DNA-binding response regulator, NarL/FixJ family, contains REC and HTH domains [Actinacidiphila cocklensis]